MAGLIALADQGIVSITNFATVILLAMFCEDSVFAAIALAGQAINYLRSAQERIISAPYGAFIHRAETDQISYTGSSLRHSGTFVLTSSLVATAAAVLFHFNASNTTISTGLLAQCLLLPCLLIRDHLRYVSFARFKVNVAFSLDTVASLIQLSLLSALFILGRTDAVSITLALVASSLVPIAGWFLLKPVSYNVQPKRIGPDWKTNWRYSRWLLFGRLFGVASYLVIPWMIAFQLGDSETALFAKAMNIIGISTVFVSGLNNYFQPTTVHAYHNGGPSALRTKLARNAALFLTVLGGLCIVYFFLGESLMRFVYRTNHPEQGKVTLILGINVLAYSLAIVAGNGLAALKSSVANFWAEFGNFIASIGVGLLVLPRYGLAGAAAAILIGSAASTVITSLLLWWQLRSLESAEPTSHD
jgi:O-antigen/teichoic acid export membrane protein